MITFFFINFLKKKLIKGLINKGGRNFKGRVCFRGQGGGRKKLYRFIDFYRRLNQFGVLYKRIKDPLRNCKIGLVIYSNGLACFLLMQKDFKLNDVLYSGSYYIDKEKPITTGFSLPLKYMPLFSILSNVESRPFTGGNIARSANTGVVLISKENNFGTLKLNSGWQLKISIDCIASLGSIVDSYICHKSKKKAGFNRNLGNKPKVRGVAMNPCDHPHGGGMVKKVSQWSLLMHEKVFLMTSYH